MDFARRDGSPLVLVSKSRCFASDPFEDVIHERVHDAHRATGYTDIGMDLLQNSVDETTIAFLPRSLPLHHLCSSLSSFASLLRALLSGTLLRTLHRRWLSTGTHIANVYRRNNLFTVLDENSKCRERKTAPLFIQSAWIQMRKRSIALDQSDCDAVLSSTNVRSESAFRSDFRSLLKMAPFLRSNSCVCKQASSRVCKQQKRSLEMGALFKSALGYFFYKQVGISIVVPIRC